MATSDHVNPSQFSGAIAARDTAWNAAVAKHGTPAAAHMAGGNSGVGAGTYKVTTDWPATPHKQTKVSQGKAGKFSSDH